MKLRDSPKFQLYQTNENVPLLLILFNLKDFRDVRRSCGNDQRFDWQPRPCHQDPIGAPKRERHVVLWVTRG